MNNETDLRKHRRHHATAIILVGLALMGLGFRTPGGVVNRQVREKFDPVRYLPEGAKIRNQERDVIFVDLEGRGENDVVIFYSLQISDNRSANMLVLKPTGVDYVRLWEDIGEGFGDFESPSGVYDLNNSGRPQIVAYRTMGASCPGSLEIYDYWSGRIRRLTGGWGSKGHCEAVEIKDLDGDGVPEIIISRGHGEIDDIYSWSGKEYVRENGHFPQYYNETLEKLLGMAQSRELFPMSARIDWSTSVVQIYIIQKRYRDAFRFCKEMLGIIGERNLSEPDSVFTTVRGEAAIHRLLGDTYKAAGRLQKAEGQYQQARMLELGGVK